MVNPVSTRGRLPASKRAPRRAALLDAAQAAFVDLGYHQATMGEIARRGQASKETLYAWFGSKQALAVAVIERDADRSARRLAAALESADPDAQAARAALTSYAAALLGLLTSPSSVALNRAAMTSPELAEVLLRAGRHRIGPVVRAYLALLHDAGAINAPDGEAAFTTLYGLVVRDTQIRVLLGEPPPTKRALAARADKAVTQFLRLVRPEPRRG